jgi:hypothetical protein
MSTRIAFDEGRAGQDFSAIINTIRDNSRAAT